MAKTDFGLHAVRRSEILLDDADWDGIPDDRPTPEKILADGEVMQALARSLKKLDPLQQAALSAVFGLEQQQPAFPLGLCLPGEAFVRCTEDGLDTLRQVLHAQLNHPPKPR